MSPHIRYVSTTASLEKVWLRRQLKTAIAGKRDKKSMAARAAQKKVEKERLEQAMSNMEKHWQEYLSESLLFKSRKELAAELIPEVQGKKRTKQTVVKSKYAQVFSWQAVFSTCCFVFGLGVRP